MANLVETVWLSRYTITIEIKYGKGKEFIGREFRKPLIEMEYGITAKVIGLAVILYFISIRNFLNS